MNQQSLVPMKAPRNPEVGSVHLQRKCACDSTGESCSRCASGKQLLQRKAINDTNLDSVPSIVNDVLASPGQPLDASTRGFMEDRFGHDFSGVRVHSDSRAAESAQAVAAKAYTVGQNVVFGQGHYSPTTSEGKRVFAHELAHVVQQSLGGGPSSNEASLEHEADRTSEAIVSGGLTNVNGRANPSVQRMEEPIAAKEDVTKLVIDGVASALGLNSTSSRLIRSGISGAVEGFGEQWTKGGTGERLGGHVKALSLKDVPAIIVGYVVGAGQGLISPITDLWSIAVMMEQIQDFGRNLLQSALTNGSLLKAELDGIYAALTRLVGPISNAFNFMKGNKLDTLKMLLGFAGSQSGMTEKMEGVAHSWGEKGGKEIAKSLEDPWEDKKKEEPKRNLKQWVIQAATKPAQTVDQLGEKAGEALVSGPWGKVGNKAGYALGFAVVQVALLVFSDGIGNLIAEIGRGLGSLAKAGSVLGKTLEGVGKFLVVGGKFIAEIERAVGALISMIAKPILPVLEPILKPFGEVMERLGKFLRQLLGVAEKEGGHLTAAAATKATGSVTHGPHGTPSSSATPAPHSLSPAAPPTKPPVANPPLHSTAPTPSDGHVGAKPKSAAKAVDDVASHTPPTQEPSALGASTEKNPNPISKEPTIIKSQADAVKFVEEHPPNTIKGEPGHRRASVGEGHEIIERPDPKLASGIACELHSKPPFPEVPCPKGMGVTKRREPFANDPDFHKNIKELEDVPGANRVESQLDDTLDHPALPEDRPEGGLFNKTAREIDEENAVRERGNTFNTEREGAHLHNEVDIESPFEKGKRVRLDSYNPGQGIVSRKYPAGEILDTERATKYITELVEKYPQGARIANTPKNRLAGLAGQTLRGPPILEVPVLLGDVPQEVLEFAERAGVIIRDSTGKVYR